MTELMGTELASPDLLVLSSLDDTYTQLDQLPESLVPVVVTHSSGDLQDRISSVLHLRQNLLQGMLPDQPMFWPAVSVQERLYEVLDESQLPRFCLDNEELVDALLADVLRVYEELQPEYLKLKAELLEEYKQQELKRLSAELVSRKGKRRRRNKVQIKDEKLAELMEQAKAQGWLNVLSKSGFLLPDIWRERLGIWMELEAVFTDLQLVTRLGFDLSKGLFQSHGWLNLVKLREVIKTLPQLQQVIRTLGRMKQSEGQPIVETVLSPIRIIRHQVREIKSPYVPMETRGVTRSDSISRMLPQEAAYLGHPVLKGLWHAKRAEHALLSYAVEGTELESFEVDQEELLESKRAGRQSNEERGPMIVCLDTSGSMHGTPENIAKALVLECLSVAAQEKRACYVYLFGSRNELKELELTPDEKGLDRLITFLSMSFGGGTDVEGPLQMALDKCKQAQWEHADILLVTDGEFSCPDNLVNRIKRRKKSHALAVHGVLIGDHSRAMQKLCDPLHRFSDWLDLAP